MSGFIATTPTPPATLPGDMISQGEGSFWPDIDLTQARASMKVAGDHVTHVAFVQAMQHAVISVSRELARWAGTQQALGFATLTAVPAGKINGTSFHEISWLTAVYSYASADICENYRDSAATADGVDRAEERASAADEFRRRATHAVRDILAEPRTAVELI